MTLYFDVELRSESRPGTEQKTSLGDTAPEMTISLLLSCLGRMPAAKWKDDILRDNSFHYNSYKCKVTLVMTNQEECYIASAPTQRASKFQMKDI